MKPKKKKKGTGKVQGFAMLYGRSSKAIRIVNGEQTGSTGTVHVINGGRVRSVYVERPRIVTKSSATVKPAQVKKYTMSDETQRKLDRLQDPLNMMNRHERAQKYEAAKSSEKYEYGLSDW
jgi:hypothetical protein